jgi:hypothetical protein
VPPESLPTPGGGDTLGGSAVVAESATPVGLAAPEPVPAIVRPPPTSTDGVGETAALDDVMVVVGVAGALEGLLFPLVPPTPPPITAPSTISITTMIMTIPFVVRQNGRGFLVSLNSFEGERESRSGSD